MIKILDDLAPLARTHSLSSCTGYHTPIEDDENGSLINEPSEMPSEMTGVANPAGSIMLTQVELE